MLRQLAVGSLLIVATVAIHAACTLGVLRLFRLSSRHHWNGGPHTWRVFVVAIYVLILCYTSLLEAAMWAAAYVRVGAIPSLEPAMYFSIVTFTTLGYGDLVIGDQWRLLAATQAATGIIMFGWTTAIVVALLRHASRHESSS